MLYFKINDNMPIEKLLSFFRKKSIDNNTILNRVENPANSMNNIRNNNELKDIVYGKPINSIFYLCI